MMFQFHMVRLKGDYRTEDGKVIRGFNSIWYD